MIQATLALAAVAALTAGLLAGASLDQSIKQLPARHRIGVEAFAAYSREISPQPASSCFRRASFFTSTGRYLERSPA
jgi:hypothetical protein